jgi:hypothetical protein
MNPNFTQWTAFYGRKQGQYSQSFELRISVPGFLSDFGSSAFGFSIIQLRLGGRVA